MVYMAHRDSAAPRPCDPYRPFFSSLYLSQELNFGPYIPYIGPADQVLYSYIGPVDQVLYSYIGPANLTMQILGTDSHIGPADQVLYSYIGPADQVLYSYIVLLYRIYMPFSCFYCYCVKSAILN